VIHTDVLNSDTPFVWTTTTVQGHWCTRNLSNYWCDV